MKSSDTHTTWQKMEDGLKKSKQSKVAPKSKAKVEGPFTYVPLSAVVRGDNGANSNSVEILETLNEVLLKNYKTFALRDAFALLAAVAEIKGIQSTEIMDVFEIWSAQLVREDKIEASKLFDSMFINKTI